MTRPQRLRGRLSPAEMFPASRTGFRTRHVTLGSGERVRVVECGPPDGTPLLLLPGWACSAYSFRHTMPAMAAAGHLCMAVELRGHGLSDKTEDANAYTLPAMTQHAREIMDALGLDHVPIFAQSLGASVAASLAMESPDRVSRLVLVNPVGFGTVRGARLGALLTPEWMLSVLPLFVRRWVLRLVIGFAMGRLGRYTARDVDEYWAPSQFGEFSVALRHLLHRYRWSPFDTVERARLSVPTLFIIGTADRFVRSRRPGREQVAGVASSELQVSVIEGAGHAAQEEAPHLVNQVTLAFLDQGATYARPAPASR